jgi:hypothetical protein
VAEILSVAGVESVVRKASFWVERSLHTGLKYAAFLPIKGGWSYSPGTVSLLAFEFHHPIEKPDHAVDIPVLPVATFDADNLTTAIEQIDRDLRTSRLFFGSSDTAQIRKFQTVRGISARPVQPPFRD